MRWLWRSDMAQFVRVLYGMLPTREELRRVLSCMVVQALAQELGKIAINEP